jgi:hypothetical protein
MGGWQAHDHSQPLFRKALASPTTSDDVKSYDLAWLLHLVCDIHQPLHATSRFISGQPHGDAGGNSVKINCSGCQETNLHWFWDDTPGVGDDPDAAIAAAGALPPADPRQAVVREPDIWDGALKAAKKVEKKYGLKNLGP